MADEVTRTRNRETQIGQLMKLAAPACLSAQLGEMDGTQGATYSAAATMFMSTRSSLLRGPRAIPASPISGSPGQPGHTLCGERSGAESRLPSIKRKSVRPRPRIDHYRRPILANQLMEQSTPRAIFALKEAGDDRNSRVARRSQHAIRRLFSEFRMTHHLLLLATLMVLVYGYSRKRAFTNFGQTPGRSAGAESSSG
jgi:hypothetical protein